MIAPVTPSKLEISELAPFPAITMSSISLVVTEQQADDALKAMLAARVLGFDTESKPTFNKGEVSTGPHLLQFATDSHVYLFQSFRGETTAAVRAILTAADVAKVGFGLNDDLSRVREKFDVQPQGVWDIGRTFRKMGYRNTVGAKSAVAILFELRFSKSKSTSTTNWANANLNEKQLLYAANDAFVALRVFRKLERLGHIS